MVDFRNFVFSRFSEFPSLDFPVCERRMSVVVVCKVTVSSVVVCKVTMSSVVVCKVTGSVLMACGPARKLGNRKFEVLKF